MNMNIVESIRCWFDKNRRMDRYFQLDWENYLSDLKSVYDGSQTNTHEGSFTPDYILQFSVRLPIHIPTSSNTGITFFSKEEESACTFLLATGIERIKQKGIWMERSFSQVEMSYVFKEDYEKDDNDRPSSKFLTRKFDFLIRNLNYVADAYLLCSKDVDVHSVTKEMLEIISFYRIIKLEPWNIEVRGAFHLHHDVPYKKSPINLTQQQQVIAYASALREEWNPFFYSEKYALSARRGIKKGLFRESVIDSQTSVETFLNALFIELNLKEGKTLPEIEQELEAISFISMLKSQFSAKLGGNWDLSKESTPIGVWYKDTYVLRNRVAHAGYIPEYEESNKARIAAEDCRNYIVDLVKAKKKKYPEASKLLIRPEEWSF